MYCNQCGNFMDDHAPFCGHCGAKFIRNKRAADPNQPGGGQISPDNAYGPQAPNYYNGGYIPQNSNSYANGYAPQYSNNHTNGYGPQYSGNYNGGYAPQNPGNYNGGYVPQNPNHYNGAYAPQNPGNYNGGYYNNQTGNLQNSAISNKLQLFTIINIIIASMILIITWVTCFKYLDDFSFYMDWFCSNDWGTFGKLYYFLTAGPLTFDSIRTIVHFIKKPQNFGYPIGYGIACFSTMLTFKLLEWFFCHIIWDGNIDIIVIFGETYYIYSTMFWYLCIAGIIEICIGIIVRNIIKNNRNQ